MNIDTLVDLLAGVRPKGIEPEAYRMVIEMLVNAVMLEMTKEKK